MVRGWVKPHMAPGRPVPPLGSGAREGCQSQPGIEASTTGGRCSSLDRGEDTCDVVTRAASESRLREDDAGTAEARCAFHHQVG